jgi:acyl-[acyl carrier protein]--UDP-N-acetylglucosamine O-acyltransferase
MRALHHAYRILQSAKLNTAQALERLRGEDELDACVAYLVAFIERSKRGVIK